MPGEKPQLQALPGALLLGGPEGEGARPRSQPGPAAYPHGAELTVLPSWLGWHFRCMPPAFPCSHLGRRFLVGNWVGYEGKAELFLKAVLF